jgi:NADH-quinone oxidoreductase subunit J
MSDFWFYTLASVLVLFSLMAVSLPNLLHGAISLIGSFFVTAALYIMLQLEFVALSQIMLYIGGIIIFMLIIILLTTGLGTENSYSVKKSHRLTGAGICIALLTGLLYALYAKPSKLLLEETHRGAAITMDDIGFRLLDIRQGGFIIPFEIISILLLVSLIGAVVLARRDNEKETV